MRYFSTVILILLSAQLGMAQFAQPFGFNLMNERNKPHIQWLSAETEHFIITYPAHLAGIEAEAAAISEETYAALSAGLNVTFDYKIRVYLSDEDEIINGFAVPFWNAYTNIWVNLNDVAVAWAGQEKWMRTVLAHELAHIFHFEAIKSNLPFLGILGTGPSLPVPWTEGIAQYFTEPWHALRGDMLLRRAFYDGRPSHQDGSSVLNGQLMYAAGNAQLRYFTQIHGDSTVAEILAYRDSLLFGRITVHNFNKGFKEVTGQSFADFEDEWRRHMNIYYHTLASQMERSDSLLVKPLSVNGMFVRSYRFSPDTTRIAVVSTESSIRPVTRLAIVDNDSTQNHRVIFEGSIGSELSWSPDGSHIVYGATARGEHGSLVNDLYRINVENGKRERLTFSARSTRPAYMPDGEHIVFVQNQMGTGNLMRMNLSSGEQLPLTQYTNDTQIGHFDIHPEGTHIAYAKFDELGHRTITLIQMDNGHKTELTNPAIDDRTPIWNPEGTLLAYTSLRDYVSNVFVIDPFAENPVEERITGLFAGVAAWQWLPADSLNTQGTLIVSGSDTKRDFSVYRIDASRRVVLDEPRVNPSYTAWLTKKPDNPLPVHIPPNDALIIDRYTYSSWRNISHVSTIPFPYFSSANDYGLGAITVWGEPLGKHLFTAVGALSFTEFADNSLLFASYINNQFRPVWSLNAYHNSFTGRIYERDYLVTTNSGGYILGSLPRDWVDSPFVRTDLYSRFRAEYTNATRFFTVPDNPQLPPPADGWQTDIRIGLRMTKAKPHAFNLIHPLDGRGVELRTTFASKAMGGETEYIRPDVMAYTILPGLGDSRFYVYGRALAQWGDSFPQDYIGFSRFDDIQLGGSLPGLDILYADAERVRGFSDYVVGNRMLFGTIEYRMPFADNLNTTILGLVSFGRTTLAAFVDGGVVWNDGFTPDAAAVARAGAGAELKNVLSLGALSIVQSLGYAQPVPDLATSRNQEVYYRIRAVIPF
ncbi:MAG: BamA/TamA family outer membrane protein [Bacteroidetes bacterium]|nr:BamA/TamA family outer membrane protein [Bacteroidota bacterium]MCH8523081.1 BamA/TamA family outer membrane protein [Balneolales bacterium]